MEMEKFRSRNFRLVLYPDCEAHVRAYEKMQASGTNYAMILHDRDPHPDNPDEFKKAHWHFVLKYKNAIWSSALAKDLGIEENYIMKCDNLDGALLYLVHQGLDDKAQYDITEVSGSLSTRLAFLLADDDESTRALNIYDIIRNSPGKVTYTEVFLKACKAGLYGDFRKMGVGVSYLISDKNADFYETETGGPMKPTNHADRQWFDLMQKGKRELQD